MLRDLIVLVILAGAAAALGIGSRILRYPGRWSFAFSPERRRP
jgi:hypothetical protein